jgi:hypothetical protein
VIDNFRQVNRLLVKLEENLPIVASMTPQLAATIREQSSGSSYIPRQCEVTAVHYLGDEGGIICRLDLRGADGPRGVLASITNLEFDPRQPFAGDVAAYQKHRIERLRAA